MKKCTFQIRPIEKYENNILSLCETSYELSHAFARIHFHHLGLKPSPISEWVITEHTAQYVGSCHSFNCLDTALPLTFEMLLYIKVMHSHVRDRTTKVVDIAQTVHEGLVNPFVYPSIVSTG